ncbi:MAG: 4-hydroxythreonine-4-phosphate dehydrogenase PdxA [Opitutaceae bacterium]|jgi:4-hydroxythreonine-4-phosphate dehydrogenase|nr:4-hydroxythreonine-4-phosphate dehydrogenase PdxA [Opitutaceae bacterium]
MTALKKLAFTCGDPAGVGPEIIAAWLAQHPSETRDIAVIGHADWLRSLPARDAQLVAVDGDARRLASAGDAVLAGGFAAAPGQPSVAGARIAQAALERAAAGVARGEFCGVVTAPVSKAWLQKAGYAFPGQTEFFAARWGGEPVMAFCGGRLRVALATWHIPLRDVPARLTPALLARTVAAAAQLARADGVAGAPRIGVCGLNPHAGEGGLLGTEERESIDPALDALRAAHPGLSRCEPGDTLFGRALRGEFDALVALYHDQGLAPLKTIDFDEAVNVTLGLPHVRTSPDHGTAFGIAGRGAASPRSFANAVNVARRLINARAGRPCVSPPKHAGDSK